MGKKRKAPPRFLAKKWDPLFAKDRKPNEVGPYVQWKRELEAVGDHLDLFFSGDLENSGPAGEFDDVKLFCEGECLETLKSGTGAAGKWRGAILDDRSCTGSTGDRCEAQYNNPLSAMELYEHLKKPDKTKRFRNPDGIDADRRRIYIAHLSPSYIFALSETAYDHQVPALRDAIWKHVALQPSIGVKIPTIGYKVFQFEFHLPYFALSTIPVIQNCPRKSGASSQRERCIDLSFLNMQPPPESSKIYGIRPVQFSLTICGSDNRHWIVYAFQDSEPDNDDLTPENLSSEGVHDPDSEDHEQGEQPNMDPIRGEPDPRELHANQAIWDPREYFLIGMEVGVAKPLKAWERLVWSLERGIEQHIHQYSSTLSRHSGELSEPRDKKKALEWTINARAVLNQLSGVLSKINRAWEEFFNESDGDIGYFSDILMIGNSSRALLSLNVTKMAFEILKTLQEKLDRLDKSCGTLAKTLKLQLILESNEVVQRSNEVLQRSNEEARQANDLVRESNEVLRKSNEEAKQASEAAQHSAVLTISIFTPIGLVAACFSMSQKVVPFIMNFRSFVISTLVMMAMANMIRLLFFASSRKHGGWRKIIALIEALHLHERAHRFWTGDYRMGLMIRRRLNTNERNRDANNIELSTIRV